MAVFLAVTTYAFVAQAQEIIDETQRASVERRESQSQHYVAALHAVPIQKQVSYRQPVTNQFEASVKAHIRAVWGAHAESAIALAKCESGWWPDRINWDDAKITGHPSHGIFQINAPYTTRLLDYRVNIEIAYRDFFLKRGWNPWMNCSKKLGLPLS